MARGREADGAPEARPPRRRRAARVRGPLATLAVAGVCAAAWWLAAPPQLGGSTTLATVDGTSMLPRYHASDLVLLRPGERYRVGDVVGYRSDLLDRIVIHRIVGVRGDRYVLRGDNNAFLDPEEPRREQLVGHLALSVPSVGRGVAWLHEPQALAALAGATVLLLGLGGGGSPHRRERPLADG